MKQNKSPDKYFSPSEYLLCDTAFEPSDICIPAYKTDAGFHQSPEKIKFNYALSPPQLLRSIPLVFGKVASHGYEASECESQTIQNHSSGY
jgi:hypothetical protein